MSEYGPAVFCRRSDGKELSKDEQSLLLELVTDACAQLGIVDDMDDEPVSPSKYDYDGYESKAVSFVLWANYAFAGAPEEVMEDFHANAASLAKKIGKLIAKKHPKTYAFDGYYVEV